MSFEAVGSTLEYLWNLPHNFEYVPGVTRFSDWRVPLTVGITYLIVIFALHRIMKTRARIEARILTAIHNFIMFFISLVCFVGMVYGILKQAYYHGGESLFCDSKNVASGRGTLTFWMYIFYLSKFYELLDTVFLAIRKSTLRFLHIYHHAVTGPLCFVCLTYAIPIQWSATTLNALVHIPMYYYYYVVIFGVQVWWKKYITEMQIIQFILSLVAHTGTLIYHYGFGGNCSGYDDWGNIFAAGIIWSYLFLFIDYYKVTYKPQGANAKANKGKEEAKAEELKKSKKE